MHCFALRCTLELYNQVLSSIFFHINIQHCGFENAKDRLAKWHAKTLEVNQYFLFCYRLEYCAFIFLVQHIFSPFCSQLATTNNNKSIWAIVHIQSWKWFQISILAYSFFEAHKTFLKLQFLQFSYKACLEPGRLKFPLFDQR